MCIIVFTVRVSIPNVHVQIGNVIGSCESLVLTLLTLTRKSQNVKKNEMAFIY